MAWRNTTQSLPLVTPMYIAWPEEEPAYHCPDQYSFGSQLLAAPFLTPSNPETRLSRGTAWLPAGGWFNFFDGEYFEGGKWLPLFGALDNIPIFARAGGIIPLAPDESWGGIENPVEMTVVMFPGADGHFELYEDDGDLQAYLDGHYCTTEIVQAWAGSKLALTIEPATGDHSLIPPSRSYTLIWRGLCQPDEVEVSIDGDPTEFDTSYDPKTEAFTISGIKLSHFSRLVANLAVPKGQSLLAKRDRKIETVRRLMHAFNCNAETKRQIDERLEEILADPSSLAQFERQLTEAQMGVLLQVVGLKNT